jgi:hypothetical protein
MSRKSSALARRLHAAAAASRATKVVDRSALPPLPLFEKRKLAEQLLATLSPVVLAETGYLERRGGGPQPSGSALAARLAPASGSPSRAHAGAGTVSALSTTRIASGS